ncbi:hypothetical protein VTJ49DRAFT_7289 [Mycothermus thermophilus]|uniref:Uncharacterized protein n=1 Tax=Humicola insolens TaxID=85995 RepID=A0ABR3VHI6_HUMIN
MWVHFAGNLARSVPSRAHFSGFLIGLPRNVPGPEPTSVELLEPLNIIYPFRTLNEFDLASLFQEDPETGNRIAEDLHPATLGRGQVVEVDIRIDPHELGDLPREPVVQQDSENYDEACLKAAHDIKAHLDKAQMAIQEATKKHIAEAHRAQWVIRAAFSSADHDESTNSAATPVANLANKLQDIAATLATLEQIEDAQGFANAQLPEKLSQWVITAAVNATIPDISAEQPTRDLFQMIKDISEKLSTLQADIQAAENLSRTQSMSAAINAQRN